VDVFFSETRCSSSNNNNNNNNKLFMHLVSGHSIYATFVVYPLIIIMSRSGVSSVFRGLSLKKRLPL